MKKMMMTALLTMACGLSAFAADNLLKGKWRHWMTKTCIQAGSKVSATNDSISVIIKKPKKSSLHYIQLIKTLPLEKSKKYKFTFDLKTTKAGKIRVAYILSRKPYSGYFHKDINVSPDKTSYECVITPKAFGGKFETPRSLRFYVGIMPESEITISNMVVTEIQ